MYGKRPVADGALLFCAARKRCSRSVPFRSSAHGESDFAHTRVFDKRSEESSRGLLEANMRLLEKIGGALATVALGGFLAFAAAGTASAHPRVVVGVGIVGPRVRYWDARFHCWRYR